MIGLQMNSSERRIAHTRSASYMLVETNDFILARQANKMVETVECECERMCGKRGIIHLALLWTATPIIMTHRERLRVSFYNSLPYIRFDVQVLLLRCFLKKNSLVLFASSL